ncbi:conserved hypothetical protein [Desulfonatronospira thiodismutans ASO3-1]|uniref:Uncharacterized protein n=1 Tax=Desulfonatronospira thiodismutans ASO3-1 TaxID=555779 RepID=D6SSA7_9BACT|nr:conserved hypothetical protein [Desulfonatronospira thiodismutans ASO3-1]
MSRQDHEPVKLDLNNPVFQRHLFRLQKNEQLAVLGTLRKISKMSWQQVYQDRGLNWEVISSRSGPHGARLYTFRIGQGFRGVAFHEQTWLRILSLHPDHDTAYK